MRKKSEITITADHSEIFFHELNDQLLSNMIVDYLNTQVKRVPLKNEIILKIQVPHGSQEEINRIKDAIYDYYQLQVKQKELYQKFSTMKKIILCILGFFLIFLSTVISDIIPVVLPEILLIAGWVAIWEVVDDLLFTDPTKQLEEKRALQLAKATILFDET